MFNSRQSPRCDDKFAHVMFYFWHEDPDFTARQQTAHMLDQSIQGDGASETFNANIETLVREALFDKAHICSIVGKSLEDLCDPSIQVVYAAQCAVFVQNLSKTPEFRERVQEKPTLPSKIIDVMGRLCNRALCQGHDHNHDLLFLFHMGMTTIGYRGSSLLRLTYTYQLYRSTIQNFVYHGPAIHIVSNAKRPMQVLIYSIPILILHDDEDSLCECSSWLLLFDSHHQDKRWSSKFSRTMPNLLTTAQPRHGLV